MLKFFTSNRFKSREFDYKPRFYDPDKEALEKRIRMRQASPDDQELRRYRMKQEFSHMKHHDHKSTSSRKSTFRLLIIIVILGAASYIVLDRMLPDLLESWFGSPEEYEMLDEFDLE